VIFCQDFTKIPEKDFIIHRSIMEKKRIFSTILVNEYGRVIFADRLGSEHLEGSLNNFKKNPIYSIVARDSKQ